MNNSFNDRIEYPFGKIRVYYYLFAGILTLTLSVPFLLEISDYSVVSLVVFLFLSAFIVAIFFKLKIYAIKRMRKLEEESNFSVSEKERRLLDRRFILLIFFAAIVLLSPVILSVFFGAYLVFLGMISFVIGFCFSEPLLYLYCKKAKKSDFRPD